MKEIDARGLSCPQPVILIKKALEEITEGEVIAIVDNTTARENVSRLAANLRHEFEISEQDGCFHIRIKKSGAAAKTAANDDIVIVVTADKLGRGEDALGTVLMKSYTYALTEVLPLPKTVIFINSGVRLTCEGSDALTNIHKLQELGVEIISCGTCLDFYNIKDMLRTGVIGNMYTIAEKMNTAAKVINIG
ncbi:MAG: sulfurtransferase-like selenium metabolism protein YedF [Bacillota bacterium]